MFLQKIFQPILRERTSAPKTRPAAACASERIKLAKKIASGFLTLSSICGVGGQCDWAEVFLKNHQNPFICIKTSLHLKIKNCLKKIIYFLLFRYFCGRFLNTPLLTEIN